MKLTAMLKLVVSPLLKLVVSPVVRYFYRSRALPIRSLSRLYLPDIGIQPNMLLIVFHQLFVYLIMVLSMSGKKSFVNIEIPNLLFWGPNYWTLSALNDRNFTMGNQCLAHLHYFFLIINYICWLLVAICMSALTCYDHFSAVRKVRKLVRDMISGIIDIDAGDEIGRVISFHAVIKSILFA